MTSEQQVVDTSSKNKVGAVAVSHRHPTPPAPLLTQRQRAAADGEHSQLELLRGGAFGVAGLGHAGQAQRRGRAAAQQAANLGQAQVPPEAEAGSLRRSRRMVSRRRSRWG